MAGREANGGGMTPIPPKAAAAMAIFAVVAVEKEEDPVASIFLDLGIGTPEAPIAQGGGIELC